MLHMSKRAVAAAVTYSIAVLASFLVIGCGSTNHDSGNPVYDIQLQWWRMETPPSVVTEFFACWGTTGLLLDQGDGNVSETQNDPMCPKNGTPYKIVKRHKSDPAVIIGTYRLVPPDSTGLYQSINGNA